MLDREASLPSLWRPSPRRLVRLVVGLWLFGAGAALQLHAGLGAGPWDVLSQGVARSTALSIGTITALTGLLVLIAWIPLRERPGLGTVLNVIVISVAIDVTLALLPPFDGLLLRAGGLLVGIATVGLASGLYLGARYGPGPRDGWMTGLHRRFGWPLWAVRGGIEGGVLAAGWLLGGTVGVGTLAFALLIGPTVDLAVRLLPPAPYGARSRPLVATPTAAARTPTTV